MKTKIIGLFLFMLLLINTLSAISTNNNINDNKLLLVRINTNRSEATLPRDIDIVGTKLGEWIEVIIPKYKLNELSDNNLDYSIQIWDVQAYEDSTRGQYHTLAEIESILQSIATNYPAITSLYSIGTTYEGRNIYCLEITDNPGVDEGEPGVLYMGLHHAREWPTVEICLHIADELTSNYGTDPDITYLVNNRRLWLVTCVNPDGYYYCHDQGVDWRKNRRFFPEFNTYGVDLNRNYAGSSNGDIIGAWGSIGPASVTHHSDNEVYCGSEPFSEQETQAVRDLVLSNDICAAITWHTHGELVLYPWAYGSNTAPDSTYMSQVGQTIASLITQQDGTGTYTPSQGYGLYPTTGDTCDWTYGFNHYVIGRPIFVYTIESCSSFHPSSTYLDQICAENYDGALYLLEEAEDIKNTVIPRVIPPVIDDMSYEPNGDYTVSWQEQNPNANPDYFQLDELTDLNIYTDDAESGSDSWAIDGFTLSTARSHSSSHSYKSHYSNEDTSAIITTTAIPVTDDLKLSFWCWYDIELEWDYAFVEVSVDGRFYEVLDSFTGASSDWEYKEYSLENYSDESIFIRFRYTTDSYTLEEGFYVDDIYPVAEFETINVLSDTITNNYYDITGNPEGEYYYRVKGHNNEHGWGDFSTLEKVLVGDIPNDPPNTPTIDGETNGKVGTSYSYTFSTTDPDENDLYYYIDWGDDTFEEWIGPYSSGEDVIVEHTWEKLGTYTIKAKAKDIYDEESDWGTLEVVMPVDKIYSFPIIQLLLDRFPNAFPVIRYILGL